MNISDIGEIALLKDILLKSVSQSETDIGDDCAHLTIGGEELLWSIDPCPRPVAHWFNMDSPEIYAWYAALINLSDIAASGGTPLGMLLSLELPDDTAVEHVVRFQKSLTKILDTFDAKLFGGNVKSAPKFSVTGSILGVVRGRNSLRRIAEIKEGGAAYLVGPIGLFWTSIIARLSKDQIALDNFGDVLDSALCYPNPQVLAGKAMGVLPYTIACMDCSDGPLNALHQLAQINSVNIDLVPDLEELIPKEYSEIILRNGYTPENAILQFGDWQLLCIVPQEHCKDFESKMSDFSLSKIGVVSPGLGEVRNSKGWCLDKAQLNENFRGGYNSIQSVQELVSKFMRPPLFCARK